MFMRRTDSSVEILAPAKLNLHLETLGHRVDGYHELETVMVAVTIFDSLRFFPDHSGRIATHWRWAAGLRSGVARCEEPPSDRDNLAWRAAERLRSVVGGEVGGTIELVKRIPTEAGLGGGSSNAAAALLAARAAWRAKLGGEQLRQIAAEIGSDVPFFLDPRPAVCRGRGEQIAPLAKAASLDVVIVKPSFGLSTARVYAVHRGQAQQPPPQDCGALVANLAHGNRAAIAACLHNSLGAAARSLESKIDIIEKALEHSGALGWQMSGSGSACFGVYANRRRATRAAGRLRAAGCGQVFVARSLTAAI